MPGFQNSHCFTKYRIRTTTEDIFFTLGDRVTMSGSDHPR